MEQAAMIPFNEENRLKMLLVAEDLQGTCQRLEDALTRQFAPDEEDVDIELLRVLDDQVMECEGCQWWCEISDLNDEQVCSDCAPEEDDD
jgi:hypothetical protein